jgi:hypothetical protein
MTVPLWLPPVVRAVLTALLVLSASVLANRLGPFWGGLIASLPVSAGPTYVFLAIDHDPGFVATSALASAATNAATGCFLIAYGVLTRRGLAVGLAAAAAVWLMAAFAIAHVAWTPATALLLNLAVSGVGCVVLPAASLGTTPASGDAARARGEPIVRAVVVALFVSAVVFGSRWLDPAVTGIVALFPVTFLSLFVLVHPRQGAAAGTAMAASSLRAMFGFGLMLLVLHRAIAPLGVGAALGLALVTALAWSGGLLLWAGRRRRLPAPVPRRG